MTKKQAVILLKAGRILVGNEPRLWELLLIGTIFHTKVDWLFRHRKATDLEDIDKNFVLTRVKSKKSKDSNDGDNGSSAEKRAVKKMRKIKRKRMTSAFD